MKPSDLSIAAFFERYTPVILALAVVLTAVCAYASTRLTLDSELERLLPDSAPSVRGLRRLEDAYGQQIGRLAIVVQGPERADNRAAVDALRAMLADHDLVTDVEARRPVDFFRKRRLLYMDVDDARQVAERVHKRVKWEKARANPMFVSLGDDDPPEVDLSDIEDKYRPRTNMRRYFSDADGRHFVVYVDPSFPNTDFDKTARLIDDIRTFFDGEVAAAHPHVDVAFSGRYAKFYQTQEAIRADLTLGTSIALVGIIIFLLIYFRTWVYPLLITVPLVASTVWTFGFAEWIFGSLNILTGFLGAVLMGLGIDYGIHIASTYQEARADDSPRAAVGHALRMAGRPSLYAGLTTLVALGSLTYSSFQAFFEFGVLAMGGLTLILASYALILPCLLLLVAGSAVEPTAPSADAPRQPVTEGRLRRVKRVALAALAALALLATWGLPNVRFEFDFRKLMPEDLPAFAVEDTVDEVVDMAQPPAVVLVDDKDQATRVRDELKRRMREAPRADILEDVFTLYDLVPDHQAEKLSVWRKLYKELGDLPESRRRKNDKLAAFYDELKALLDTGRIGADDLPEPVQRRFRRTDDPSKTVVLILPSRYVSDATDALRYVSLTADLPGPTADTTVDPISQEALLAEILGHIKADTVWLVLIALVGLIAVAWMAFHSVRRVLFAMATVAAGVYIGTGLIGLLRIPFNFMNMVIWPIWLGLGVDAVFHLSNRVIATPSDWSGYRHTAGAVFAAFFTTMIGFGSLMVSGHRGLASLGQVAVVGLGSILLVSLAVHLFLLEADHGADGTLDSSTDWPVDS